MDIYKAQHMAFPRGPVYLAGSIGTFLLRIGDEYISIIFKMAQSQVHNQKESRGMAIVQVLETQLCPLEIWLQLHRCLHAYDIPAQNLHQPLSWLHTSLQLHEPPQLDFQSE